MEGILVSANILI